VGWPLRGAGGGYAAAQLEQGSKSLTLAGPAIGRLPVDQIDTVLVMRCVEPIWTTKTETTIRLRGRIESVLYWSIHLLRGY
jgi:hypothetical protein